MTHRYDKTEGKHIMEVSERATPIRRLHELAHAKLQGTKGYAETVEESTRREIEADLWVNEKTGRDYSIDIFLDDAVRRMIHDDAHKPKERQVYREALKLADEYGLYFNEEDKRELRQFIEEEVGKWRP